MSNVYVSNHPLIQHKLSILRSKETGCNDFRRLICEVGKLLCYEVTRDLPLSPVEIETPMRKMTAHYVENEISLVPILRAGLGMVDGFLDLMPQAHVYHLGFYRNEETLQPVEYYNKLEKYRPAEQCLILDPMLATGGSAIHAADIVKRWGAKNIKFVGLIGAPEGINALQTAHPDVDIFLAAIDEKLNDVGYILPGLGDAGDRLFNTLG